MIARIDVDVPRGTSIIIPNAALRHIKPSKRAETVGITCTVKTGAAGLVSAHVALEFDGVSYGAKCLDGVFPDFARVIPKSNPTGIGANYQSPYLRDFNTACRWVGPSRMRYAAIRHDGPEGTAMVSLGDDDHIIGFMRPFRNEGPEAIPAWVRAL